MNLKNQEELSVGDVVTLEWAREYPKEEAPLFLVVGSYGYKKHHDCQVLKIYCYFSNHKDRNTKGWIHRLFEIPESKLIKYNFK